MPKAKQLTPLILMVGVFAAFYYLPFDRFALPGFLAEALGLAQWYAREHVILCLVPAFFIAGAISCFVSQASVLKYLGPRANKVLAYGVASVSGSVLAVCSCTVLPLFAGIYKRGAGLGPAAAFLYSGPAINVLAIVLTAKVLGPQLGVARAVGAVVFSIIVGLMMHLVFRREEIRKADAAVLPEDDGSRPLWKTVVYFACMVAILVFANWSRPQTGGGLWESIYSAKWIITGLVSLVLGAILVFWFGLKGRYVIAAGIPVAILALVFAGRPLLPFTAAIIGLALILSRSDGETRQWLDSTWGFARQMLPLLFIGVLIAGALLGRPGGEGLIPP
ncbi:MAG: permease, partial [bacterium]